MRKARAKPQPKSLRGSLRWLRPWIIAIGTLLLLAFATAWSGLYSVAASRGHWPIVELALAYIMRNSVETHAVTIAVPDLDVDDMRILGASHFYTGCAPCHGAPGQRANPVAQSMLPAAPDLSDVQGHWKDRELFWIVKHGIKYTGMPAWATQERDDEVWAVVSFLKALPELDANEYATLAGVEESGQVDQDSIASCARCHGAAEALPRSNLVPVLHGQPTEFLLNALQDYAHGRRHSGFMQPVASDLSDSAMKRLAEYFAKLPRPERTATAEAADAASVARGEQIATRGVLDDAIPPCLSCHGADALGAFPRLAGQNAAYMQARLHLWKAGKLDHTESAAIMAPIAKRLTQQQIGDVTAYFSTLRPAGAGQ